MTHDAALDALPHFVLEMLDEPARVELAAHLRDCASCRLVLGDQTRALDALGRAVPQVQPRRELRDTVLSSIVPSSSQSPAVVSARRGEKTLWPWAAFATAALLAIVTTVSLVRARSELNQVRSELAAWQTRVAAAEQRAVQASSEATVQRQAVSVLTSSDLIEASLSGVAPAGGARARAFLSLSRRALVLSAQGLPPLPAGRVYQLWAVVGSRAVSAGLFTPDAEGRGQIIGRLPALDAAPAALAVTLEPEGGVDQPTGPKYLIGAPLG
ncbi:MAG: anti-sigma factor domain-containing protein [Vicinamibacterales bacterium]